MKTELSSTINKLILDIKNAGKMDNSLITEIVKSNKLSEKNLSTFASFNHANNESYGRKLIYNNENFKLLLMSWKAGDFTAIHNHGYTDWGCMYFFGEASHRLYEIVGDELKIIQKDNFHKSQIAQVCGDLTHMMGNTGLKDFTTLHIYGSNTRKSIVSENAKVYLPEFQKVVTTIGPAYLILDRSLVQSEEPLLKIGQDVLLDYFTLVKPFYERNKQLEIILRMEKILNNYNDFYQN